MSFLSNLVFGKPPRTDQPVNSPPATNNGVAGSPPLDEAGIALAISKAIRQLEFAAKNYGFTLTDSNIDSLKADLGVMLRFRDLKAISLDLLGREGRAEVTFKVEFVGNKPTGSIMDTADGSELPVMPNGDILVGRRLVVHHHGGNEQYRHLLILPWSPAKHVQKSEGATYPSEHWAKVTGGRQAATVHVTDAARRRFVITSAGPGPFRFAKDLDSGQERIFVQVRHWPAGYEPRVGAKFTALLIQAKKGLQVRAIRPL